MFGRAALRQWRVLRRCHSGTIRSYPTSISISLLMKQCICSLLSKGQLGDCWFLSALAVLGAHESLLRRCFWREEAFKEFGLYVLRFYKDCNIIFVVVDDRIPVKAKDGRVIFAENKDANELWVPIIEKAYAKLHGCYKALIGGFTHYGLADLTGYCPRLLVLKEGYLGFAEKYEEDELWNTLMRYKRNGFLMGCSIQPNPKEKRHAEAEAGQGLYFGHAYSLLDLGEIDRVDPATKKKVRLLKLRNPWGRGEWDGAYSDDSKERHDDDEKILKVFVNEEITIEKNDGTFFIPFQDWLKYYTSVFVAMKMPQGDGSQRRWMSRRTQGQWSADSGGNREMGTWLTNPKVKLEFGEKGPKEDYRLVFVGLYIKDSRLTLGGDYYKVPLPCRL